MSYKMLEIEGIEIKSDDPESKKVEVDNFESYEKNINSITAEYRRIVLESEALNRKIKQNELENKEQYEELYKKWLSQIKRNTKLRKENEELKGKLKIAGFNI